MKESVVKVCLRLYNFGHLLEIGIALFDKIVDHVKVIWQLKLYISVSDLFADEASTLDKLVTHRLFYILLQLLVRRYSLSRILSRLN